jgi:hypothetical protein
VFIYNLLTLSEICPYMCYIHRHHKEGGQVEGLGGGGGGWSSQYVARQVSATAVAAYTDSSYHVSHCQLVAGPCVCVMCQLVCELRKFFLYVVDSSLSHYRNLIQCILHRLFYRTICHIVLRNVHCFISESLVRVYVHKMATLSVFT